MLVNWELFLPTDWTDLHGYARVVQGCQYDHLGDHCFTRPDCYKNTQSPWLRTVKKEVLKLIDAYITKADDVELVDNTLITPLFEAVLADYTRNVPDARDAEVLNVMAAIVAKLGALLTDKIHLIFDAVFECTLQMINKDFAEFPEHRVGFYKLLRVIDLNCFPLFYAFSCAIQARHRQHCMGFQNTPCGILPTLDSTSALK